MSCALIGRWLERSQEAGLAVRALAIAMAETHLRPGRHVVIPQFLGRIEFIEQLEATADRVGAKFTEVALTLSREEPSPRSKRAHERSAIKPISMPRRSSL